eukprot:557304-Pleurochrysis_carterae.AAC.1
MPNPCLLAVERAGESVQVHEALAQDVRCDGAGLVHSDPKILSAHANAYSLRVRGLVSPMFLSRETAVGPLAWLALRSPCAALDIPAVLFFFFARSFAFSLLLH